MNGLSALIHRNFKLFFKDKGMFFTSLITPIILLVLYVSFLGNVYHDSFLGAMEQMGVTVPEKLVSGCVAGQLFSSLLAVCCVTVSFCSNMLMVQDRVTDSRRDLTITPVKRSTLALSYYISTALTTLAICLTATMISLVYVACMGWYLSAMDVVLVLLDVLLLTMFGTALSSIVSFFLSSQGQVSAVGTIVSSGYGFICGAYMPISQFGEGLQRVLSFLPGTYGTALLRNHALGGVFAEMERLGVPTQVIEFIGDYTDCNLYFFSAPVSTGAMYVILGGWVLALMVVYILINYAFGKKARS